MSKQPAPDPLFTLRGEMGVVHSLLFQLKDDSEHLYASTQAGAVHKWNLQSCREESKIQVSGEACLSISSLHNSFISQAKGGEIKLWEEEEEGKWKIKTSVNLNYWGFCKFGVSNGEFIVCPESGSKIKIINVNGEIIKTSSPPTSETYGEIMALKCFTLSGSNYVFVLYECGLLTLFDIDGRKVSDCKVTSDCPMALDFDGESKCVVGSSGDVISGFELTTDLELMAWKWTTITNPGVSCVVIRPDKKLFVAGCWDARIRLFSMKSFKLLAVLTSHKETIQDVCYSPARVRAWDTEWLLAAAGKDGRVTLWSIY